MRVKEHNDRSGMADNLPAGIPFRLSGVLLVLCFIALSGLLLHHHFLSYIKESSSAEGSHRYLDYATFAMLACMVLLIVTALAAILRLLRQLLHTKQAISATEAIYDERIASYEKRFAELNHAIEHYEGCLKSEAEANRTLHQENILLSTELAAGKVAIKAIEEKYQFNQRLIEHIPIDMVIMDTSHRYRLVNPHAIKSEEIRNWIIGKDDYEYCAYRNKPKQIADLRRERFNQVMETMQPIFWEEFTNDQYGNLRCLRRSMTPVISTTGHIDFVIGYGVDITDIKEVEKKMLRERERLDRLAEHVPGIVFEYQLGMADQGSFYYISQRVKEYLGIGPAQAFKELNKRVEAASYSNWLTSLSATDKAWHFEGKLANAEGNYRWYRGMASPVAGNDGKVSFYGLLIDVHEQKTIEETLLQRNQLLYFLSDLQSRFTLSEGDSQGVFDNMLSEMLKLTGSAYGFIGEIHYDAESMKPVLSTRSMSEDIHAGQLVEAYRKQKERGEPFVFHNMDTLFGHVVTTGEIVIANNPASDARSKGVPLGHAPLNSFLGLPVKYENKLIGMLGLANKDGGYSERDAAFLEPFISIYAVLLQAIRVEEHRRAMLEELTRSEAHINAIVNSINEIIFEIDHQYHYVNIWTRHEELLLLPASAMLGKTMTELLSPEQARPFTSMIDLTLSGQETPAYEYKLHIQGKEYWFQATASQIIKKGKPIQSVILFVQNITELKHTEERLRALNQSKDRIVAAVAHDLRNPLMAIKGLNSILQMSANKLEEEEIQCLEMTEASGNKAIDIINELLEVAELESENYQIAMSPVRINHFIEQVAAQHTVEARNKKVAFITQLDAGQPEVLLNHSRFTRAIDNIISNALKFTREGDSIIVRTTVANQQCIISIADTGIGIPKNLQPLIFDKFTKAKRMGLKGEQTTGLGMSIVNQIVEMHQGQIWFESQENKGTTFYISLPVKQVLPE